MNYSVIAQKLNGSCKENLSLIIMVCFPPSSGRMISVLQRADVNTEIWRAGWPIPDRNSKRRFITSVNRPSGHCCRPMVIVWKWLNVSQSWLIYQSIARPSYKFHTLSFTYSYTLYGCKVGKDYSSPFCSSAASWETRSFLSKHSSYMPWTEHCTELYTQRSANVGLFYLLFCSRNARMNNSCM